MRRKVFNFNFHTAVEYGKIIPIPKAPSKVMVRDGFSINSNQDKADVGQDDTMYEHSYMIGQPMTKAEIATLMSRLIKMEQ